MFKNDKKVADKNSNIYNNINYKNNNVIITISLQIENPGIVRTVYSGIIFGDIQQYFVMFRYIEGHLGILRDIQGGIIKT